MTNSLRLIPSLHITIIQELWNSLYEQASGFGLYTREIPCSSEPFEAILRVPAATWMGKQA